MQFHPTPIDIAKIIKKHLPRALGRVLEPSAGNGALISVLDTKASNYDELCLVDICSKNTSILNELYSSASIYCADFLNWEPETEGFETIISNPPFFAKSGSWIACNNKTKPIEFIFVEKCLDLLVSGGVFIAILPSSVIASDAGCEIRRKVLEHDVMYSYQLPGNSFDGVEGVFYALIIKNQRKSRKIKFRKVLSNGEVEEINVSHKTLASRKLRLDFDYHSSFIGRESLVDNISTKFPVCHKFNFSIVKRGSIRSNYKQPGIVHSTYYSKGMWSKYLGNNKDYLLVCKRVSRDCNYTFGILDKALTDTCTDCVVLLTPPVDQLFEALFFLRVVFTSDLGRRYLVRGTGSKYLSVNKLKELSIVALSKAFPLDFEEHSKNYINGDIEACMMIEKRVFLKILHGESVSSISKAHGVLPINSSVNVESLKGFG